MAPFLAISWPGGSEWIIILLIVMLLFGARKLPELARGLGRSMSEFKKGREEGEKEDKTSANSSLESKPEEPKSGSKIL